jgi:catechol 2,3-dioxygenase
MLNTPTGLPISFSPRRLGHANILVRNLEESLTFYNRVCGLEIVMREPPIGAGFLTNGNTHHDIGLIQVTDKALIGADGHQIASAGQASKPRLNHLGWEMESEFDLVEAYRRAVAAGFPIHRTVRHKTSHSVYIFDPEGNSHEFYADIIQNWRDHTPEVTNIVSGNWTPGENLPSRVPKYVPHPEIRRVEGALIHPLRITHAAVIVRDLGSMRAFFAEVAGLREIYRADDVGVAAFASRHVQYPVTVALFALEGRAGARRGLHHAAFQVADENDLVASERRVAQAGIEVVRSVDNAHKRSFFVRDPNGILLEFYCARAREVTFDAIVRDSEAAFLI